MLFRDKDCDKVELIYNKYFKLMRMVAYSIMQDSESAQDMVQESVVKIINKINIIKDDDIDSARVRNLIITIVKNTCLNELKRRKIIKSVQIDDLDYKITDETAGIEEMIISADSVNRIYEAVNKLEYKYSSVLKLKFFNEFNDREIAEIMELSPTAVRVRIHRGKKLLSKALEKVR